MKIILILIFATNTSLAQDKDLSVRLGDYTFDTKFDSSNYLWNVKIVKGIKTIYKGSSEFSITDIKEYDLDNNGQKEILIDAYSGGAHCCTYLCAAQIRNDKFNILDTIYWGNSNYSVQDLNGDGKYEIKGVNDIFAYAFTNYAQSEFPLLIYAFENNKFMDATGKFPNLINEDLKDHMSELKPYLDTGFACPENTNEDTFNTDAGAVKAILAPIVADYYALNEISKGYNLIDSVYKCPDKNKFKEILKNEYKLR